MKNKRLLVIGGSNEAQTGIQLLVDAGIKVILLDGNPSAPGRAFAHEFIQASVYDPEESLRAVIRYSESHPPLDGALVVACDAVMTLATITNSLGLPGLSMASAERATDKTLMKDAFDEAGLPSAEFRAIHERIELKTAVRELGGPLVLKPCDGRGSRGVVRIDAETDLDWCFDYAMSFTGKGRLILERWLEGPQLSTESLVWDGRTVMCGIADRNYDKLDQCFPHVIENGGTTPSQYAEQYAAPLDALVLQIARALGIQRGTIKGDIVLTPEGPKIIEIAARLSGGYFSTVTIGGVYGTNLVVEAARIALGLEPRWEQVYTSASRYQENRYLFLEPGIIEAIHQDRLTPVSEEVTNLALKVKAGDEIGPITYHTQRHGVAIVIASSPERAKTLIDQSIRQLRNAVVMASPTQKSGA
jgi:biotin carboxylase